MIDFYNYDEWERCAAAGVRVNEGGASFGAVVLVNDVKAREMLDKQGKT